MAIGPQEKSAGSGPRFGGTILLIEWPALPVQKEPGEDRAVPEKSGRVPFL